MVAQDLFKQFWVERRETIEATLRARIESQPSLLHCIDSLMKELKVHAKRRVSIDSSFEAAVDAAMTIVIDHAIRVRLNHDDELEVAGLLAPLNAAYPKDESTVAEAVAEVLCDVRIGRFIHRSTEQTKAYIANRIHWGRVDKQRRCNKTRSLDSNFANAMADPKARTGSQVLRTKETTDEERRDVEAALKQLSMEERHALLARLDHPNESWIQLAARHSKNAGALRTNYHRAKKRLADQRRIESGIS